MRPLALAEASLIAEWAVGVLFGMNCILFANCASVLVRRRSQGSSAAGYLLAVAIIQLFLSAGHATTLFIGVLQAFHFSMQGAMGPLSFLSYMGASWHLAEEALFMANECIGSAVLVWRCYTVWECNIWLAFPLILTCIATPVPGAWCTFKMSRMPADIDMEAFFDQVNPCLVPFGMLSVATKVSATVLIAWRVWTVAPRESRGLTTAEWFAVRILAESGALCSGLTVIGVVLVLLDSPGGHVVAGMLGQISATAPYLIIIRSETWREKIQDETDVVFSDGPFDVCMSQSQRFGPADLVHRRTREQNGSADYGQKHSLGGIA